MTPAAWRDVLAERQQRSEDLQTAVQRWMQATLSTAFLTWRDAAAEQWAQRRALARFNHTALSRAWGSWQGYVEERRQRRQRLQVAVGRWASVTLSSSFAQVGLGRGWAGVCMDG